MGQIRVEDAALADEQALAWVNSHFSADGDAVVTVAHGTQAQATVPHNDLVRTQSRLPDGRLVRVDHVSPRRGAPQQIFVMVEKDLSAPRPSEQPAATVRAPEPIPAEHVRELLGKERLLTLWFEGSNLEHMSRDSRAGVATLKFDEVTLFTRPQRTMTRAGGHGPYVEVDGLAYWLEDDAGKRREGFGKPHRGGEQGRQSTFDYFEGTSGPELLAGRHEQVRSAVEALRQAQVEDEREVESEMRYERMRG